MPPAPAGRRATRRRWLRPLVVAAVGIVVAGLVLGLGSIAVLWPLTPSVADAGHRVDGLLAAHKTVPMLGLPAPDPVGQAIIATENSRFTSDFGLDPISVVRTVVNGVIGNSDQGAATLEIQLAKNLYTPGRAGNWAKVEEVELSFKLDTDYTKNQVLLLYLNAAYFGHGLYGLDAAARGFFGVTPDQLDWAEASLLAGLVQAPSAYNPYNHLPLAKSRQHHVLNRLVATGVLTQAEANTAYAEPLHFR